MAEWDGRPCMEIDAELDRAGIRHCKPSLGSTIGDPPCTGHTTGSNHYPQFFRGRFCGGPPGSNGQARDYGTACSDADRIARHLEQFAQGRNYVLKELIWTRRLPRTGIYYKRGLAYTPSLALAYQHRHHCHAAIEVGRHFPDDGVTPEPLPLPRPEEIDVSMFVKGDNEPTVYQLSGAGLAPVGKPGSGNDGADTLIDLWSLGYGHDPIPGVRNYDPYWQSRGIPVVLVTQRFIDQLR